MDDVLVERGVDLHFYTIACVNTTFGSFDSSYRYKINKSF